MFVETLRSFVFSIEQDGEHSHLSPRGTNHRVGQESALQPLPLVVLGNRQSA